MWRASAVRKNTEPLSTPTSLSVLPRERSLISTATSWMRCAICSSVNRMRSIPGGSLLMASRLIASRSYLCSYFGGPLRQAVLEDQVFEILLIEDLHGQVRIQLPQQPDLAVLARHQRLFHGGEFHVQIELRQIEIGRERFGNASLRIPLYRKIARLVLPGDAVEIQQVSEDLLALVGEVLAGQPHHAGRHDAMPCQAQADLKLDLRLGRRRQKAALLQ